MKRALFVLPLVAFAPTTNAKPAPTPVGEPSKAVTPEIIAAIEDEMGRAMTSLEIPGAPKPYHISYKVTEVDVNDVAASLGHSTSRRNRHFVNIEARVRVGSPDFDNGNFVVPSAEEIDGVAATSMPIEATPRIAKRATWSVTDQAYKEALMQLRAKVEARRAGGMRTLAVPAWTSEPKVVSTEPVLVQPLESLDDLEARAKKLSSLFRDQPHLRESRVAATSYLERRWYVTTEGTKVTDTRRASGILLVASGQADDGQPLSNFFLRYGTTAKELPTDAELEKEAKEITESIAALAKAPLMKRYSGPVIFEGEGAVGVVRFTLAPHLGGTPVPEGLNPQQTRAFGGLLTEKVGLRVLGTSVSIYDDPTAKVGAGKSLIGGFKTDDEGVAARRVDVIKNGMLKTLLLSRTPSAKGQQSNGHARRTADGGAYHGTATNLFVVGKGSVSRAELQRRMLAAARAEGLGYGLVIKRFDDASITSAPEFSRRELIQMLKSADQTLPPPAILAYKVYPNGKRELVRGVQLLDVPIRAWKDILGTSTDVTTYNFLASTENQVILRVQGGTDDGYVPSGGIESGIITPDILIKEIDIQTSTSEREAPQLPKPIK